MEQETGWLIETADSTRAPRWWAPQADMQWTSDASKALRFARKEDAETMIEFICIDRAKATEHMWLP